MDVAIGERDLEAAALRGEPSYSWRAGQAKRLDIVLAGAGDRAHGRVLDNGCGVGEYLARLASIARQAHGVEFDFGRARVSRQRASVARVVCAAGQHLPYASDAFELVLSHEVLEHVAEDRAAAAEIVRVLKPRGRLILFVPNRGYPFETHGVYWRGRYIFGNIPLVNYLPRGLRDRLAPHVRVYSRADVARLFTGLPVAIVSTTVIFGAYDNLIARWPRLGRALRAILHALEGTPLRSLGLSHVWIVEKV